MIFKNKAIEEGIDSIIRQKREKENVIRAHRNRLIELQKSVQAINKSIIEPDAINADHHKSDPLKQYKTKSRQRHSVEEIPLEIAKKIENDNVKPHREFDQEFLENSGILYYNARDYIEESLIELTKVGNDFQSNEKNDREVLRKAKRIFKFAEQKTLDSRGIHQNFQSLFNSNYIPQTKCTPYFEAMVHKDFLQLQNLQLLAEKGGSRLSGRKQNDIIFEKVENSKHVLALWRKLLYNTKLYILSHIVFVYHDTLRKYQKQSDVDIKEKDEIFKIVIKGLLNNKPLIVSEIKELVKLIKNYSKKMEHTGITSQFTMSPDLNDWINDANLPAKLPENDYLTEQVQRLKSQRQKIQSIKSIHDDYDSKIKEYSNKIERIEKYIQNLDSERENYIVMREHQNIREYQKEIEILRHEIDQPKLKLMDIEVNLFKYKLALFQNSVGKNQGGVNGEKIEKSRISMSPWLYDIAEQVTRLSNKLIYVYNLSQFSKKSYSNKSLKSLLLSKNINWGQID